MVCLCEPVCSLPGDCVCQGLERGLFEESVLSAPWEMPL